MSLLRASSGGSFVVVSRTTTLAATLTSILLSIGYAVWEIIIRKHLETKKPLDRLPMPPGSHWLRGHLGVIRRNDNNRRDGFVARSKEIFARHTNEHGQSAFWAFNRKVVYFLDWKDARLVLRNEHVRRPTSIFVHYFSQLLGPRNIIILNGRDWKVHRAPIARALTSPTVLERAKIVSREVAAVLVRSLGRTLANDDSSDSTKTIEMDVEKLMKMLSMDAFGRVAFSYDFACCSKLQFPEFAVAFSYLANELTRRLQDPFRFHNWFLSIPTKENRLHRKYSAILRTYISEQIQQRRTKSETGGNRSEQLGGEQDLNMEQDRSTTNGDLLSEIIALQEKDLSDDETLNDVLLTLLFAGYDTTSIALTYAIHQIAENAQVEENLLEEVRRTDKLEELKYTEAVLLEALRLFPPAVTTTRNIERSMTFQGDLEVPAGFIAVIPIWSIHRAERNFPQAECFRPDRWVERDAKTEAWKDRSGDAKSRNGNTSSSSDDDGDSIAAANRNAFFAFSAGGRSCPGQKFAVQEATIVLATLVRALKFELLPGYELSPTEVGLVQAPKGGLPMIISERK